MMTTDKNTHEITVDKVNFNLIQYQIKKAGVCKFSKHFKTGDLLKIREYDTKAKSYTGNEVTRRIMHITFGGDGMGIQEGYMLLSMDELKTVQKMAS